MTRRLAITILLAVWASIIVAGLGAWLVSCHLVLAAFDDVIAQRAQMLRATDKFGAASPVKDEAYVLKDPSQKRLNPAAAGGPGEIKPRVVDASFSKLPAGYFRNVTLEFPHARAGTAARAIVREPAGALHAALYLWLPLALAGCGIAAGTGAALAAVRLARMALRPLSQTAETIGGIDESRLDRRIPQDNLPTELRPMAARLNEMLERLQKAFEQRRRFLADASHELRTPVAAMMTTMEVALRRPRSAEELAEVLRTCLAEASHMRLLVQALLRQVRADGALADEQLQPVDAGQLVRECADLADSLAAEKQVRIVRGADGLLPVLAEPGRLRSVVLNLVSNAIEYNQPGGTVEVRARADNGSTEITVEDDGPGITPEHLPHLFQPFYRGTDSRESDGHLGLGLFLVDSHVRAMGGQCLVESALGSGTIFRVRLPSLRSADQTPTQPSPGVAEEGT